MDVTGTLEEESSEDEKSSEKSSVESATSSTDPASTRKPLEVDADVASEEESDDITFYTHR